MWARFNNISSGLAPLCENTKFLTKFDDCRATDVYLNVTSTAEVIKLSANAHQFISPINVFIYYEHMLAFEAYLLHFMKFICIYFHLF